MKKWFGCFGFRVWRLPEKNLIFPRVFAGVMNATYGK